MEEHPTRFRELAERWFLTEPALFAIYCTHELTCNNSMPCPLRAGRGRLEYNPALLPAADEQEAFQELVGIEMLRLLLKHPYERLPERTPRQLMKVASDMVLTSHYVFHHHEPNRAGQFGLPEDRHFEWYLAQLLSNENGDPDSNSDTYTAAAMQHEQDEAQVELWEEDEARQLELNTLISNIKDWGSLPGGMVETVIANTRARIDYRRVLSAFRASVLCTERRLTRLLPNRRTGFTYMGSRRAFATRLLLAVDVSGSVSSRMLAHFYSVITRFFTYGIRSVDVIPFDSELKGSPRTLKAAARQTRFNIQGRGGTDFQPVFDYISEQRGYDGLIILTDGEAPPPVRKPGTRTRVAWVCESEEAYNTHHTWMERLGKACYLHLK